MGHGGINLALVSPKSISSVLSGSYCIVDSLQNDGIVVVITRAHLKLRAPFIFKTIEPAA